MCFSLMKADVRVLRDGEPFVRRVFLTRHVNSGRARELQA
jgi:hypothetical protein